jgi:autotransporter-associated beta strand protein
VNARFRSRPACGSGPFHRLLWAVAWLLCGGSGRGVESSWVWRGDDGLLDYRVEADGDRIPDFSMVGFGAGWSDLPATPPVAITVASAAGDSTARIQAAIDQVARRPLQLSGFRGAVQLAPGDFEIAGQLRIAASGVVLRGSGTAGGSATRLIATGASTRDLIAIGDAAARRSYQGSKIAITDERVPVGGTSFAVTSTTGLAVGQAINVNWTSNQAWIEANGMDKLANPWLPGQRQQNSDRIITRIEGNRVVLDAPITSAIDKVHGGGTIQRYAFPGRITHVGIENLVGQSLASRNESNEARAWSFIGVGAAEHVFVRDIEARHFVYATVDAKSDSKFVTVANASSVEPAGLVTGSRRYTYNVNGQLALVTGSTASEGRHDFVTGSNVTGPSVFVDGVATVAKNDVGPHHRWASGILFDNIDVSGNAINVRDRGNMGTGHGWAGANTVIWNSAADSFILQNPPTAQNWLIGSEGRLVTEGGKTGTYDSLGTRVSLGDPLGNPADSLYLAQLQERRTEGVDLRFWVGDQGGRWTDSVIGTNWSRTLAGRTNAALPGPRDDVVFNAAGSAAVTTRPGRDTVIHGLVLDAASAPVTLRLGATDGRLTLGPHGITSFAGSHTIVGDAGGSGAPGDLIVAGSQTWEIRGTSRLSIDARLGRAGANGDVVTKTGSGTLVLAESSGGSNSFKAGWRIAQGVVRIDSSDAFGWSYNPVAVASGGAIELAGVGLGIQNADLRLAGQGVGGTGSLRSLSGSVALGSGSGGVTLDAGPVGIGVDAGTLTIHRPMTGPGELVKLGAGRLVLAGGLSVAGGVRVAAGTLELTAGGVSAATEPVPAPLLVTGGRFVLPGDRAVALAVTRLDLRASNGGLVDLGAGRLTVAAGGIDATTLRSDIIAGRAGGSWSGGSGITSAVAAAAGGNRAVGYTVAADGTAVVAFAAPGDTNLDGQVNVFDLLAINTGGSFGKPLPAVWSQGDFDYDGVAAVFDLVAVSAAGAYLAGNYLPSAAAATATVSSVPEPGSVGLAATGILAALVAGRLKPSRECLA